MTVDIASLDAHEQPSEELRARWKACSKTEQRELLQSEEIDDLQKPGVLREFKQSGEIPAEHLGKAFGQLRGSDGTPDHVDSAAPIYYHPLLPGLLVIPNLLPPELQKILMDKLVHRDLSVPTHQTNLHLHYDLPYPNEPDGRHASFFSYSPDTTPNFTPHDPEVHKHLSIKQVLERRLHWVTLGGQYDWTNRVYPDQPPPRFPADIADFLHCLFPETVAQAAIVNFYTPGDTMMMHRDVSEETDKGLVSISLGCDALFMIAPNATDEEVLRDATEGEEIDSRKQKEYLLLRLRSGDAIYMTQDARYAWHGVPKVLKGTCPEYLEDWPAEEDGQYDEWRGWMKNKRINLNVRQMTD